MSLPQTIGTQEEVAGRMGEVDNDTRHNLQVNTIIWANCLYRPGHGVFCSGLMWKEGGRNAYQIVTAAGYGYMGSRIWV